MSAQEAREIWLVGEPEFPHVMDEHNKDLDPSSLDVSAHVGTLIASWLTLARADVASKHDQTLLAGLRAATAIAREAEYRLSVFFVMIDPREGNWFTIQVRPNS
jgi:hypothetical protein